MKRISEGGLYVHIPFCAGICPYCAFSKLLYREELAWRYLECLKEELKKYSSFVFNSVYIGGGTPSSLSVPQLRELFDMLRPYAHEASVWTMEANPDLAEEKLPLIAENVRRISLGIQTVNRAYQETISRISSPEAIRRRIRALRAYGIADINADLMYGFKGQGSAELDEDLDFFLSLELTHISAYCLQIEEGTVFGIRNYPEPDPDRAAALYERIVYRLRERGFERYEVSNFAKPGYRSAHNLLYWNNCEYGGLGLGASSYIGGVRRTNTKSITEYLKGRYEDYEEPVSEKDREFYFLMLGLRKEEGISLDEYRSQFGKEFLVAYREAAEPLMKDGLLLCKEGRISVAPERLYILDFILRKLLF